MYYDSTSSFDVVRLLTGDKGYDVRLEVFQLEWVIENNHFAL